MKRQKRETLKMILAVAAVASIKMVEYWQRHKETSMRCEARLNKKLNRINLLYHAIGIFYNE